MRKPKKRKRRGMREQRVLAHYAKPPGAKEPRINFPVLNLPGVNERFEGEDNDKIA